jgi:cellobiose transport system permease protein
MALGTDRAPSGLQTNGPASPLQPPAGRDASMSLPTTTAPPPPATLPERPQRSRSHRLVRLDIKGSPYLYILPFFLVFGVFGLYRTAWISLHDWNLIAPDRRTFVGLANYKALLQDDYFWNAVFNTVGMFLLATIPQLVLALVLANMLNRGLRWRTFFRMSILVPNVTSVAAVGIVFGTLFQRDFGVINWVLDLVGINPIDWRNERWAAWTAIATMVDWRWTGYNTLILLAAMQAIPRDLYECAALDGAGPWRQMFKITIPMLRPTLIFVVIVSTIGGLQLFTEPLIFSGDSLGGPVRQFQTVAMYMYEKGIETTTTAGYGAAVAGMLFLMIIIVSVLNFLLVRRSVR